MSAPRPSTADKRKAFRALHASGCFVIPNPWNVGSARYLQGLGFKALASTSAGHAHAMGYPDGGQTMEDVLAHYRELTAATDIPLNADFENGFADDPAHIRSQGPELLDRVVSPVGDEAARQCQRGIARQPRLDRIDIGKPEPFFRQRPQALGE